MHLKHPVADAVMGTFTIAGAGVLLWAALNERLPSFLATSPRWIREEIGFGILLLLLAVGAVLGRTVEWALGISPQEAPTNPRPVYAPKRPKPPAGQVR